MKLSRHFRELSQAYAYEIEDLRYDSGGDDVLKSRIKIKRDQFAGMLMMIETDPVMVAPAFHRAFHFHSTELAHELVAANPDDFPSWKELRATLDLEPWAEKLAATALASAGGEEFMVTAAGLEFILTGLGASGAAGEAEYASEPDEEDEQEDLGEAGDDFLGDHGFDRRNQ